MTNVKVLKNALGGQGCRDRTDNPFLIAVCESNFPTGEIQEINLGDPISGEELVKVINARTLPRLDSSKLIYGESDFLPFAFLGRGLRVGVAVCRLIRQYSEAGTDKLLKTIEQKRYSIAEVSQLLGIASREEFWKNYADVFDAFQADASYRDKLREIIRNKRLAVGSGFLVASNYLLTNHHVLHDQDILEEFTAQFLYEKDGLDQEIRPIECKLDSSFRPVYLAALDYALIRIKPFNAGLRDGKSVYWDESATYSFPFSNPGDNLGWLQLSSTQELVAPPFSKKQLEDQSLEQKLNPLILERVKVSDFLGEPINIIQHPKGRAKEIVIYNNRTQEIYPDFIKYETDAEPGSSGSPLLNSQWQLVGLHHSALISEKEGKVMGYLGTRVHRIVEDLREQSATNPELTEFLRDYVDKPRKGRIFIVGGLTRDIDDGVEEAKQMKALRESIFKLLEKDSVKYGFEVHQFPSTNEPANQITAIDWLNDQGYRVGDVALELLMDSFRPDLTDPDLKAENVRGASVYYVRSSSERKAHAELLVQSLQRRFAEQLPNRGAKSDNSISIKNGLPFCRKVNMPSLVLYVGFLTSPDLQLIVENNSLSPENNRIALGIKEGLLHWMMSLSPLYAEFELSTIASRIGGTRA